MTMERIGGHEGMTVYRTDEGLIKKVAIGGAAADALVNEYVFLCKNAPDIGPAPHGWDHGDQRPVQCWTLQEDLGVTLADAPAAGAVDPDELLLGCIRFLASLREQGIRHGDLTPPNLVRWGHEKIKALDWQESHLLSEPAPPKRTTSDSWQLMDTYANLTGDPRRIARRWMVILKDLGADGLDPMPLKGQTFLDLGCYEGWFPALAAAEGMSALGIDENGGSIEVASEHFGTMAEFQHAEIAQWTAAVFYGGPRYDVVTFLSTWPYIINLAGVNTALETLRDVIRYSEVMYFESQLFGDGPGPEQLRTKMDVAALLSQCGGRKVEALLDIPIEGRDATRTLWSVR